MHLSGHTKKNQATSLDKQKSCNLLGPKIAQPLRTKKSHNQSGQKSQATSRDKKETRNLMTQKITKPLGGENHATSWDRKIPHTGDKESLDRCG